MIFSRENGRGYLAWGVKSSFVEYISALPDGRITVSNDVTQGPDGQFYFPLEDLSVGPEGHMITFRGKVSFWGHAGALNVDLSNLHVHLTSNPVITAAVSGGRLPIAFLPALSPRPDWTELHWSSHDVALSIDGAMLLGNVYGPHTRLDPVTIVRFGIEPGS